MALFRLTFPDPGAVRPEIGARPVWLILAMTPEGTIRLKPQNLLAGLPLRGVGSGPLRDTAPVHRWGRDDTRDDDERGERRAPGTGASLDRPYLADAPRAGR